jgi:F-type H+-transporting ATPase subunit delta
MRSTKLASRYAKSLFEFARERNQVEQVNEDLKLVKAVIKENRELKAVIESPIVFPDKKNAIFSGIFSGKISDTTFGFLSLLIKKRREPALTTICDEYTALYNILHNIKIAHIITAVPMSKEVTDELTQLLEKETHATIKLQENVDPDIIGGLIGMIDGYLFDASIISSIKKLRDEFSQNIYKAAF